MESKQMPLMSVDEMNIHKWRDLIDTIDLEILALINKRCTCALEIGRLKKLSEGEIHDPKREKDIIKILLKANNGPMPQAIVEQVFIQLIAACRQLQKKQNDINK